MNKTSVIHDIFISYRNDGVGEQFASRLYRDLTTAGYSVFFNPDARRRDDYRDKIREGVEHCKDFILVLSEGCLGKLKQNTEVDWVRYEILLAREKNKHIIPVLIDKTRMPEDARDFPEELKFLPYVDAISFPANYLTSPFSELMQDLHSVKRQNQHYTDCFSAEDAPDICREFLHIQELAEQGDDKAMFTLACMYYWGTAGQDPDSTQVDYEQAAYWLRRVINNTPLKHLRCEAQGLLGKMYYLGSVPGEPQSYEKAYVLQKSAAEKNVRAQAELIYMTRTGCGCRYSYPEVRRLYEKLRDHLNDQEIMGAARYFSSIGHFREAAELFESVENMTPDMEYELGMLYKRGVTCDPPRPDLYRAAFHLRNAADGGNITASYQLGLLHFNPTGEKGMKNFAKAEKCFFAAAEAGHPASQYILGFMYKFGHVKKDSDQAIRWLEKAVSSGNTDAAVELVALYWAPEHRNYQRACECAKIAAMAGIPDGELLYGTSLLLGRGCPRDPFGAKEWLDKAEAHGISHARMLEQL